MLVPGISKKGCWPALSTASGTVCLLTFKSHRTGKPDLLSATGSPHDGGSLCFVHVCFNELCPYDWNAGWVRVTGHRACDCLAITQEALDLTGQLGAQVELSALGLCSSEPTGSRVLPCSVGLRPRPSRGGVSSQRPCCGPPAGEGIPTITCLFLSQRRPRIPPASPSSGSASGWTIRTSTASGTSCATTVWGCSSMTPRASSCTTTATACST